MSNTIQDTGTNRYEQVRFARRRVPVPSLPGPQSRAMAVLKALADYLGRQRGRNRLQSDRKPSATSTDIARTTYGIVQHADESSVTMQDGLIPYQTGAH